MRGKRPAGNSDLRTVKDSACTGNQRTIQPIVRRVVLKMIETKGAV